jgi:type VI protein secretion system component VasK
MTARGLLPLSVYAVYALAVLAASKWLFGANALLPMTVFLAAGVIILAIYLFLYWYIKGARAQATPASGVRAADAARTAADLVREADTTLEKSPVLAAQGNRLRTHKGPLYLCVGDQSSGKTEVFLQSGLDAEPIAGRSQTYGDVDGSDPATLWYTRNAIFADIGCGVFEKGKEPWLTLLRALRGESADDIRLGARGRNLRGVIMFCDISPLLEGGDLAENRLLERLRQIGDVFGVQFPVYVVFTNANHVAGFEQFFSCLAAQDLRQVLGCTFPLDAGHDHLPEPYRDAEGRRLVAALDRLAASLEEKLLPLLHPLPEDVRRKAFDFLIGLPAVRPRLVTFLLNVFPAQYLQLGPRLRGLYFIGKVQNEPAAFAAEIFHQVILRDWKDVPSVRRVRPLVRVRVAFASVAVLALFLTGAWARSWNYNRRMLESASSALQNDVGERFASLAALRVKIAELRRSRDQGLLSPPHWGLYSGDQLEERLRSRYFEVFRTLLLDPIRSEWSTRFQGSAASNSDQGSLYATVKAYQMVHGHACPVASADEAFVAQQMLLAWRRLPHHVTDKDPAGAELSFYASELAHRDPYAGALMTDAAGLAHARAVLNREPSPSELYTRVAAERNGWEEARLASFAARHFGAPFYARYIRILSDPSPVPAFYTAENQADVRKTLRAWRQAGGHETCVIGSGPHSTASLDAIARNLELVHFREYGTNWKAFLHNVKYVVANHNPGPREAAEILDALGKNDSPLLGVLSFISTETAPAVLGGAESTLFEPVRAVVPPDYPDRWITPLNKAYVDALSALAVAVRLLEDHLSNEDLQGKAVAARAVADKAVQEIVRAFPSRDTDGVNIDVERLLRAPLVMVDRFVKAQPTPAEKAMAALKAFRSQWDPISAKYPFHKASRENATVKEVTAIYEPENGAVAKLREALKGLPVGPDVESFLQAAEKISLQFFPNQGGKMRLWYKLAIAGANTPTASVEQNRIRVVWTRGGESKVEQFLVPLPEGASYWDFVLKAGSDELHVPGPWSIYRLIDASAARLCGEGGESLCISIVSPRHTRNNIGQWHIGSAAATIQLHIEGLPLLGRLGSGPLRFPR